MSTVAQRPARRHPGTAETIERTALEEFFAKGYHGASIRAIAKGAGVGIATLFHHFPSKASLLEQILLDAVEQMRGDIDEALGDTTDPRERLIAATRALALAHCERQEQSFVAQSELRSLKPAAAKKIRAKRREIQHIFDSAVEDGIAAGEFQCDHPHEVARAIVSLGTAVAVWYRNNLDLTPEDVADINIEMALRLVGAQSVKS